MGKATFLAVKISSELRFLAISRLTSIKITIFAGIRYQVTYVTSECYVIKKKKSCKVVMPNIIFFALQNGN